MLFVCNRKQHCKIISMFSTYSVSILVEFFDTIDKPNSIKTSGILAPKSTKKGSVGTSDGV